MHCRLSPRLDRTRHVCRGIPGYHTLRRWYLLSCRLPARSNRNAEPTTRRTCLGRGCNRSGSRCRRLRQPGLDQRAITALLGSRNLRSAHNAQAEHRGADCSPMGCRTQNVPRQPRSTHGVIRRFCGSASLRAGDGCQRPSSMCWSGTLDVAVSDLATVARSTGAGRLGARTCGLFRGIGPVGVRWMAGSLVDRALRAGDQSSSIGQLMPGALASRVSVVSRAVAPVISARAT